MGLVMAHIILSKTRETKWTCVMCCGWPLCPEFSKSLFPIRELYCQIDSMHHQYTFQLISTRNCRTVLHHTHIEQKLDFRSNKTLLGKCTGPVSGQLLAFDSGARLLSHALPAVYKTIRKNVLIVYLMILWPLYHLDAYILSAL